MVKREAIRKQKAEEVVFEEVEDEGDSEEDSEDEENEDISPSENQEHSAESEDDANELREGYGVEGSPTVLNPDEWRQIIQTSEFANELVKKVRGIRPAFFKERAETQWKPSGGLRNLAKGLLLFLNSEEAIPRLFIRNITNSVFGRIDIFRCIAEESETQLKSWELSRSNNWKNILNFIKSVPLPSEKLADGFFSKSTIQLKMDDRKRRHGNAVEKLIVALSKCEMPTTVSLSLMDWLSSSLLSQLPKPQLLAQYLFSHFSRGSTHAVFALDGLFVLVVKHNFEYPRLFEEVYSLITPSSFYLNRKKKFLSLVDSILSSTHLSSYIVASFVKKLSRCLLYIPFDMQESLQGLIRNAVTRHPTIAFLLQRETPDSVDCDPFNEEEKDLKKNGAMQSSLWELKTIERHWLLGAAKRARFVDGTLQKIESFVRFRDDEGYWNETMTKAYGEELVKMKYKGEEDDEEAKQAKKIRIAERPPDGQLFPSKTFLADYDSVWKLN